MKIPVIFFGASQFVLPLIALLQKNYDLTLVVTTEKNPQDTVPAFCKNNHIPFVPVTSLKELKALYPKFVSLHCPVALLADFGVIVPQSLIDIFPKGIVNIHPSLLPKYRGPTPGQTALLLGDTTTGVSLMLLDKEVDHGPILAQEKAYIATTDTAESLYKKLFAAGTKLLENVLPAYLSGKLQPTLQNHTKATFTKALSRDAGFIDSSKPIAKGLLHRMIRAYYPWPGVWTTVQLNNKQVRMKLLPEDLVQIEGKKPMSHKDFMNGYTEGKAILEKLQLK